MTKNLVMKTELYGVYHSLNNVGIFGARRLTSYSCSGRRLLLLLCALANVAVFAAEPPASHILDRELDLQEKIFREEQIRRELESNKKGSAAQEILQEQPEDNISADNGVKFLISKIEIDAGEHSDISVDVSDVVVRYQNRELSGSDIFQLLRDVSNRYTEKGYSTTTIGLVPGNLKNGIITLKVQWGKVEGWLINGEAPVALREKIMIFGAMPDVAEKPLNIYDVDQAIENLNNSGKSARIDIQPSHRLGYSLLNIITQSKSLADATLRADNSGRESPSNGRYRFSLSSSISDFLLGNDTLAINGSSRRFQIDEKNSEYSAGLSYSLPVGYSKLDLRYNDSQYSRSTASQYGTYDTHGDSKLYSAKLSRVVMRNKTEKLTVSAALEHKKNFNYVKSRLIEVNSRPYTSATYSVEHVTRLLGGSLYSDISYSRGQSYLGGRHAAYSDENRTPIHFQKFEANAAWARPLELWGRSVILNSRVGAVYSRKNMLESEQLAIGDEYTVRGFRNSPMFGDQGVFSTNTLNVPIAVMGGTISPLVGLDAGYVKNVTYDERNGSLAGFAVGVTGSWKYGGGSVVLGVPLMAEERVTDITDPVAVYISTFINI